MNERDARAAAEKVERRFGGRIFPADNDDVLIPVRMGVGEVVRDMREIFAGNSEPVRAVVVAGGDDDFTAAIFVVGAGCRECMDDKRIVLAVDLFNVFIEACFEAIMLDGATVIF